MKERMTTGLPGLIGVLVLGGVYAAYVLYPLLETLRVSLLVNGYFSVSNYIDILGFGNSANFEAMRNSVLVSLVSVLFSGVLGLFFAFVFTQCDFPFSSILGRVAVLPIALPPLVGVIAFLFVFGESGILPRVAEKLFGLEGGTFGMEGFAAIVAVHTYSFYVYFYLFASTALRTLDASQLEAAQTFGSSTWRTLTQIVLPELRPAMIGAAILTFMASMASFSAPLLFAGEQRFMTLQIYTAKLNGELPVASADAIVLTTVSVLFFVVLKFSSPDTGGQRKSKGTGKSGVIRLSRAMRRVLVGTCLVLLVLELLPVIVIVLISFAREGSWTWQILPDAYTGENYARLLSEPRIVDPIINSMIMSVVTVVAGVLIGVSVAYLLTKGRLRTSRFTADIFATLPFAIPGTVIAISLILAFNTPTVLTGGAVLVGTFWILPLAYFIRMFPLIIRSTSASLEQLDDSLLEAGMTFGAGTWRRFRKIVLPVILPGIVSGALLVMITALGEFVSSVLLYAYSNRPISVEILAQMRTYNFGAAAAYSVALLVLIMLLTFLSKLLVREGKSGASEFNI